MASLLGSLDIEAVWTAAEEQERRVLVEELVEVVGVFPDHLEVTVTGAPSLNLRYGEVGLKESGFVGVGGGIEINSVGLLTPTRRGDQPISERESVAIRCARWEPPSYGYRLPNGWAQAHATDGIPLAKLSRRDIETDNPRPQTGSIGMGHPLR